MTAVPQRPRQSVFPSNQAVRRPFNAATSISAVPGGSYVVFTDSRDLVSGSDPREFGVNDDEDGFEMVDECCWYMGEGGSGN